jgi:hypothetical protein
MSSTPAIRLPASPIPRTAPPTAAVEAAVPADRKNGFAAQRETGAAAAERRNLPAVIPKTRTEGTAVRQAGDSLPYLAQHIVQEVLGPSRVSLDLRFHGHPGLAAYAAMQAAEPQPPATRRAWA